MIYNSWSTCERARAIPISIAYGKETGPEYKSDGIWEIAYPIDAQLIKYMLSIMIDILARDLHLEIPANNLERSTLTYSNSSYMSVS